jgi:hypothetical protein
MNRILLIIAGLYLLGLAIYLTWFVVQGRKYKGRVQDVGLERFAAPPRLPAWDDAAAGGVGNLWISDDGKQVRVGRFTVALEESERWLLSHFARASPHGWSCTLLASERFGEASPESRARITMLVKQVSHHLASAGSTALLSIEGDWVELRLR